MNKAFALYQAVLLGLHSLDLYTTSRVTVHCEGNPIMRAAWSQFGFGGLVALKVLCWGAMLVYHLAILTWLPEHSKSAWLSMAAGFVFMVVLVVWNICMVYIRR